MQQVTSLETIQPSDGTAVNNKEKLDAALKKHGFKIDDLVTCGIRGMNAKKLVRDSYGDVLEELEDHATQHKFFHSFLLLLGMIKEGGSTTQVVVISPQEREIVEAMKRKVEV